jgi:hypothetical protein
MSLVCLLAGAGALRGADGESTVVVNGIAHFNGRSLALLEITGPSPRNTMTRPIVAQGERSEQVEVTLIDEANGLVRVLNNGVETTFNLGGATAVPGRTFQFKDVSLGQMLEILQQLTGTTVLAPDTLPGAKFSLSTGRLAKDDARRELETALRLKGIETQERGEKFVFAVQSRDLPQLAEIKELPAPAAGDEMFPAGMVRFMSADLSQAFEIYQELSRRTILRPGNLPWSKITVRSQREASRAETTWMIEALFAINGVKMIPEGEKFAFALPAKQDARPPAIPPEAAAMPATEGEEFPAGALKWFDADVAAALNLFASLVGREALPVERSVPSVKVSVRSQQSLTRAEAVYALNALAALNGLNFVAVGDRQVKLLPAAEARRQSRLTAP